MDACILFAQSGCVNDHEPFTFTCLLIPAYLRLVISTERSVIISPVCLRSVLLYILLAGNFISINSTVQYF